MDEGQAMDIARCLELVTLMYEAHLAAMKEFGLRPSTRENWMKGKKEDALRELAEHREWLKWQEEHGDE